MYEIPLDVQLIDEKMNRRADRDKLRAVKEKLEEAERMAAIYKQEAESIHQLHLRHLMECYRYLDIDGSDGEFRSKWVLLELSKLFPEKNRPKEPQRDPPKKHKKKRKS